MQFSAGCYDLKQIGRRLQPFDFGEQARFNVFQNLL
jgi:hypothetical protein